METPLIVAAQNSAIRAITSLTALGADVDAQDANGNTAMHYAVLNSSDRAIDSLAHAYANFNIPNAVGRTAMHLLSISNSPNLARLLCRNILRIDMTILDQDGNTPFMAAVRYDSSRMVHYFLQLGYRPEGKEKDGNTPLHIAVRSKNLATIKLLARKPHINFVNDDGRSPLAAAIAIGNEMAMEILWRHNADPHVVDKAGNTLLLLACAGPSIVILKHILEHCSEVSMCNVAGETALHLASAAKNSSVIFEICKRGETVTAQDCRGRTPLMIAIMSGNRQAAAVQLEWQFAAGTDLLSRVDLAGLNASQYCDLFADLETKECIRNLEMAFVRAQQIPVQTRTIYFNIPPETVDLNNENNDPLDFNSDESTDSDSNMPVLTL
jgi:ankyrin repeat protein